MRIKFTRKKLLLTLSGIILASSLIFGVATVITRKIVEADGCNVVSSSCCGCGSAKGRICCFAAGQYDYCYDGSCGGTSNSACACNPPPPPPAPPPAPPPGPPPPPPPPPCTATTPAVPTLVSPANGAVNLKKPVTLSWTNNAWGVGCPQSNQNRIFYKVKSGPDCVAGAYASTALFPATTTKALDAELNWGTTYCWYAAQNNGSLGNGSAAREFTTLKTPTFTGYAMVTADVCGTGAIGKYTDANGDGVNDNDILNPAKFRVIFTNPDSLNIIDWVALTMIPVNAANTATKDWASVVSAAVAANSFIFNISDSYGSRIHQSYNQTTGTWSNATGTTISSTSGSVTLRDFGPGGTNLTVLPGQTIADFNLQFNTLTAGTYDIYAMAYIRNPAVTGSSPGFIVSSDATATSPLVMRKAGQLVVDLVPPAVNLTKTAGNPYNVTWSATDTNPLSVYAPYIYSDTDGAQIRDNTGGAIITTNGNTMSYPTDTPNGLIAANGTRSYSDWTPSLLANYTYKLYAKDNACNLSSNSLDVTSPSPWILGNNGNVSGVGGVSRIKIPNIPSFTLPPYITTATPAFLANYSLFSGDTSSPTGNISKYNQEILNYPDESIISPNTTNGLWYDYLLDKVTKNGKTTVSTFTGPKTILTTISSGFAVAPHAKIAVKVTGDLTIGAATTSTATCDTKAIIFVEGNLVINPDFTITAAPSVVPPTPVTSQTYNGCMFIVKGNATITGGSPKPAVALTSSSFANYDSVNAMIVTDGTFSAPVDSGVADNGQGAWSVGTTGGTAKYGYGGIAVGTKIYYWAGVATGSVYTNAMNIYDTSTGIWSTGTAGGSTKVYFATGTDGTKIYYWGGLISGTVTNTMNIFNTATNTWTTGAVGPVGREGAYGATSNGKMYVWGGWNGSAYVNTMNIYNMATNTWTTGTSGGTPKGINSQAVVYNNKIYFPGGCITNNGCGAVSNTLDIYDIATNTWSTGANLPVARGIAAPVLHNNKMFLIGGYNAAYTATVFVYDFGTNTWVSGTPLNAARGAFTAVSLNGKIYAWGGYNGAFLNTLTIYTAPADGNKWDGLYINGGLVANSTMNGSSTTLLRNINSTGNDAQPALVVNNDPRYKLTWGDDLASRDYNVREFGL